jgi:RNA polymerase sigma-70 factor (ECF subfamily)
MVFEPSTRASLLARLQGTADEAAWRAFVARYQPTIHVWCLQRGLQEADAQDVTQTVLTILARRMKEFTYDPNLRFRAWLHTVTRNAWSAFVEARGKRASTNHDGPLMQAQARDDLVQRMDQQFDLELMELAMANVRERVEPHTWSAFRLTAIEQERPTLVAERLGMKVAAVYVARSKVQKMVRAEMRLLEGEEPEE